MKVEPPVDVANNYLDGYVFLHSRASWLEVCKLWQDKSSGVRFAAKNYSGPDEIVVFVEEARGPNDHENLRAKLKKVESKANPSSSTATAIMFGTNAPSRWSEKQRYAAHVRIKATDGMAEAVFDALDPRGPNPLFRQGQGYNGHALCEGDWNVLLELGADSGDELTSLVDRLDRVPNIDWTIVTSTIMEKRQPQPPQVCEPWT